MALIQTGKDFEFRAQIITDRNQVDCATTPGLTQTVLIKTVRIKQPLEKGISG